MHRCKEVIGNFVRRETVFCISFILAIVSAVFVKPSVKYFGYINYETLILLLVMMVVVQFLSALGVFKKIAFWLLKRVKTSRQLVLVLVMLCFVLSMLITNDVALLTFVPFTFTVLGFANCTNLIMPTVILQTVAANLGSMLLPIGNPQNIYLYSISGLSLTDFVKLVLPYYALSFLLIMVFVLLMPSSLVTVPKMPIELNKSHIFKRVIYGVDWFLLLTFICFFIFIGNMRNIHSFQLWMQRVVAKNELLISILSCQLISNVPAAIMLSGFTNNYSSIILGTNIGGLGTLIASMASLISYKLYAHSYNESKGKYILYFSAINLFFLIALVILLLILT